MILVWSTRVRPAATASARVCWRTRTTSSDARMASCSALLVVAIDLLQAIPPPDQRHAALDIEGGAHAGQRKAQLDQRDGDCRAHAHDHRVGIEDARDRGDVVEH